MDILGFFFIKIYIRLLIRAPNSCIYVRTLFSLLNFFYDPLNVWRSLFLVINFVYNIKLELYVKKMIF